MTRKRLKTDLNLRLEGIGTACMGGGTLTLRDHSLHLSQTSVIHHLCSFICHERHGAAFIKQIAKAHENLLFSH